MDRSIPDEIWSLLSCPQCAGPVEIAHGAVSCHPCNTTFPALPRGGVDLRLQRPRQVHTTVTIEPIPPPTELTFEPLKDASSFDEKRLGHLPPRLPSELLTRFPNVHGKTALMLDLGCGSMLHRTSIEQQGFLYIGLDFNDPQAMFLGDAQALPFKEGSFTLVLSIAVIQEVQHPEIMLREAFRVLEPGGMLIGSAAYLETYLGTYHHFTHLGLHTLLRQEGFAVEAIAPNPRWTVPMSLLRNGLFPSLPEQLGAAFVFPLRIGHRLWWWLGRPLNPKATEKNRLLLTTGSFFIIARKPIT